MGCGQPDSGARSGAGGIGAAKPDHVGVLLLAEEQISQIQGVADDEGVVLAVSAGSAAVVDLFQNPFFLLEVSVVISGRW